MIYLDFIGLSFLIEEIKEEIYNYKLSKIIQFDKNSFSLFFSKKQLFFQIKDNETILYIKEKKEQNMQNYQSPFFLTLKKYIQNAILKNIEILNCDRIVRIEFSKIDLIGNLKKYYLVFEIMGRHSNIFLLDENERILNVFNNNFSIENSRFYALNSKYEIFTNSKISLEFDNIYTSSLEMLSKISGIGKIFAEDTYDNIILRKHYSNNYKAYIFTKDSENILTYNKFKKYDDYEINEYDKLNYALNDYFTKYKNITHISKEKIEIEKYLLNKIKKNNKLIETIKQNIENAKNYEKYREIGDILTTNIYLIKSRMSEIILFDYYNSKDIKISLDENKDASENIKIYYNKYRKLKKSISISKERLEEVYLEIEYLKGMLNFVSKENELLGLLQIKQELGILKNISNKQKDLISKRELLKYGIDGFEIYVGRNNIENDYLTFSKAKSHDIWLHVRDIPGSHVIIVTNKKQVSQEALIFAATLAKKHSKGDYRKIIDYTERRNVKRKNKYGNVTFNNFSSLEV